jgi:hypothetical protein
MRLLEGPKATKNKEVSQLMETQSLEHFTSDLRVTHGINATAPGIWWKCVQLAQQVQAMRSSSTLCLCVALTTSTVLHSCSKTRQTTGR